MYMEDKPTSCCAWLSVVRAVRPSLSDARRRNLDIVFNPFPLLLLDSQISVKLPNHLISGLSFSSLLLFQRNAPFLI